MFHFWAKTANLLGKWRWNLVRCVTPHCVAPVVTVGA